MQEKKNIIDCYDKTSKEYADAFINELSNKHLDRLLLTAFASENVHKGKLIDLGCGPGQTTNYLSDCGMTDLMGVDISPAMVTVAKEVHPSLHFETADILDLPYADQVFGSAIAFYSIVHFDEAAVKLAFRQIKRVLKDNGQFLFSFHIGNHMIHIDYFLDHSVDIDFYFFEPDQIVALLTETGFEIIDIIVRHPYKDVEYSSKRAYIWVTKNSN